MIMHGARTRITPLLARLVLLLLFMPATGLFAAQVKDSLDVVARTNADAAASQQKIDKLSQETRQMLEEYRRLLDGSEYQEAYARELADLNTAQQQKIDDLQAQIAQARITRQRIVPLMRSMADALERFVVLDLPFRYEERISSVVVLKQRLDDPGLSVSAKFRLLLEAYQIEQNYGGNIEAWRGPLQFEGKELSVEYLRVGRTAYYFQSLDGNTSGYWHVGQGEWLQLDADYNRTITQALRVAKNMVAPQLLQLPMLAPGDAS